MTFAEKAKMIMKQRGIAQNELARQAGLSSSGISTTLREGGNPRESSMVAILDALGMTFEEFWADGVSVPDKMYASVDPQLLQIYLQLNQEARDQLMDYANYLLSRHEHKKEKDLAI